MRSSKPADSNKRHLLDQLKRLMAPIGFSTLRSQELVRKVEGGTQVFHVSFDKRGELIEARCDIASRIDAVEDLVHRTMDDPLIRPAERSRTATFGAGLSNLAPGGRESWSVTYPEAIPIVATEMTDQFLQHGVPFLLEYSEQSRLIPLLLGEDARSPVAVVIPDEAAMRAVALAFISNSAALAGDVAKRAHAMVRRRRYPEHRLVQFCTRLGLTPES